MKFNKYDDINFNIIGTKLKAFREKAKISQDTLSNKLALLGITLYQSDIYKIEKNQRTVRDFELWGICSVLNIKAEDLFQPNIENGDK